MKQDLISKNVTVNGRRTSLRLEEELWEALNDVCRCESTTIHELCSLIDNRRHGSSRTSSVRTFIIAYFRIAAHGGGIAAPGGDAYGNVNSQLVKLMATIGAKSGKRGTTRGKA